MMLLSGIEITILKNIKKNDGQTLREYETDRKSREL